MSFLYNENSLEQPIFLKQELQSDNLCSINEVSNDQMQGLTTINDMFR